MGKKNHRCRLVALWAIFIFFIASGPCLSQEEEVGIKDNSFLIEEAYNQEKGVIQHVFNLIPYWDVHQGNRHRQTDFLFTQEWPIFSQTHQFSYSIPYVRFTDQEPGGPIEAAESIGDIMLNYRYQAWGGKDQELSFSPRFSVVLPSGDENLGIGTGKVGYQFALPISKEFDDWCFHFNMGMSVTPDVNNGIHHDHRRTLNGYNLGGSAIYKCLPNFHFMLETVSLWNEDLFHQDVPDRTLEVLVSPGVRWAPYTNGDTQWVLGIAAPVGVTGEAMDFGLFFYMSFEHAFTMAPRVE